MCLASLCVFCTAEAHSFAYKKVLVKSCLDDSQSMQLSYDRRLELSILNTSIEKTIQELEKDSFVCSWNKEKIEISVQIEKIGEPQKDEFGIPKFQKVADVLAFVVIDGEKKNPFSLYLEQAATCLNSSDRCIIETDSLTISNKTYKHCVEQWHSEGSDVICQNRRLYHLPSELDNEERKKL